MWSGIPYYASQLKDVKTLFVSSDSGGCFADVERTQVRQFILCAGFGYEFVREPFAEFVDRRAKMILDGFGSGEELKITIYYVGSGVVKTIQRGKTGPAVPAADKRFAPVTKNSYKPPVRVREQNQFKDNQPDVMSITNIYEDILAIGRKEPGTLIEVSLFSHAFYGGPILVNSHDDGLVSIVPGGKPVPVSDGLRDPDDKDGRSLKDFVNPNMTDAQLLQFRNAFSSKGYYWVWGCSFPTDLNRIFNLVHRNKRYSPSISDDQPLEFSNLNADQVNSFKVFQVFFDLDWDKLRRTRKCVVKFGSIKDALLAGVSGSYVVQLALQTKVRAIGAFYGTWAQFYGGSPPLMAISTDPEIRWRVEFYKRHFNFKTDSELRNYGVFDLSGR